MALGYLPEGRIQTYYNRHLGEERGHAEMMQADLASAAIEPPAVHWKAARLAGTQAYLIHHVSPLMLLGYMAALECRPWSLTQVAYLENLHGKPLMRCIRYHAEHDAKHGPELLALIDTLTEQEQTLIASNAGHTAWLLQE